MQKKIGKNQNRIFGPFWGRCRSFCFSKYSCRPFFFLHFLMPKIRDFIDDLTKSTLLAGANSKSYGNFNGWICRLLPFSEVKYLVTLVHGTGTKFSTTSLNYITKFSTTYFLAGNLPAWQPGRGCASKG